MKNFQQTPKQRRVMLSKTKAQFQNTRNMCFQPRAAWESKRKVGGVVEGLLLAKQFWGAVSAGVYGPELREADFRFDLPPHP